MRHGDAEAEIFQRLDVRLEERLREDARGQVLVVVRGLDVATAAVRHAVEVADRIVQGLAPDVAVQLHAGVTVRGQQGWEAALHEPQPGRRLQTLQAHFFFELAHLQLHFIPVVNVDESVLQHVVVANVVPGAGSVGPEIEHDLVLEILEHRALENRTDPAEQEAVVARDVLVQVGACIRLNVTAYLENEVAVRRTEVQSDRSQAHGRYGFGLGLGGLAFQLPVAFQNFHFLIQGLKLLFQLPEFFRLILRQHVPGLRAQERRDHHPSR